MTKTLEYRHLIVKHKFRCVKTYCQDLNPVWSSLGYLTPLWVKMVQLNQSIVQAILKEVKEMK